MDIFNRVMEAETLTQNKNRTNVGFSIKNDSNAQNIVVLAIGDNTGAIEELKTITPGKKYQVIIQELAE